jgi:hypothetical protein
MFVSDPTQLNDAITENEPDYIFFLHWSWIVPSEIIKKI